jgi:hypothetical protein
MPQGDITVSGIKFMDPETGSMFVRAGFTCQSQSDPATTYHGRVQFNGCIEVIECDCKDFTTPEEELDYLPAYLEGHRVCKHASKALIETGYSIAVLP